MNLVDKVIRFGEKYIITIVMGLLIGFFGYHEYQRVTNPVNLKDFKGSIQNHLVWSVSGECFFVLPHTNSTVYLVSVNDCNKDKK
jgi:hypothetical protein